MNYSHFPHYRTFDSCSDIEFAEVTVHGRFQPPLHINYYAYISEAFRIGRKVTILITNPDKTESDVSEAPHRSDVTNNPFSYEERVFLFCSFFERIGISRDRYDFRPFDITDQTNWEKFLDKSVPNLVNTYGEWSYEKLRRFLNNGYPVIHSSAPKNFPVSGTLIRSIIFETEPSEALRIRLVDLGYMPEAVDGLFTILKKRKHTFTL